MSVLGALSNSMTGVKVPSFLISHHIAGVGGLCVAATCHQAWESSQPTLQQLRKAKQRDTKFWTTLTCAPGIPPRFVRSEELWWSGLGQGPTRWKKSEVHAFQRLLSAVHVWCWVLSSAKSVQSDCQTAHNFFPFESTVSARSSAKVRGSSKFTLFAWWTLCWQPACVTLDMMEFLQQAQLRFPGFDAIDVIAVQYITSKFSKKQQKITQISSITSYGKDLAQASVTPAPNARRYTA